MSKLGLQITQITLMKKDEIHREKNPVHPKICVICGSRHFTVHQRAISVHFRTHLRMAFF